jgi:hypothetical protein
MITRPSIRRRSRFDGGLDSRVMVDVDSEWSVLHQSKIGISMGRSLGAHAAPRHDDTENVARMLLLEAMANNWQRNHTP